jgi:hypothetical protein
MVRTLSVILRPLLVLLLFASANPAIAAEFQLPPRSEIFVVGFHPQPKGFVPYFDESSFLATYSSLKPAKVTIAVGARRVWQSGVIVTKDKKVLFWSTCAKSFVAIDVAGETKYFAADAEVFVQ